MFWWFKLIVFHLILHIQRFSLITNRDFGKRTRFGPQRTAGDNDENAEKYDSKIWSSVWVTRICYHQQINPLVSMIIFSYMTWLDGSKDGSEDVTCHIAGSSSRKRNRSKSHLTDLPKERLKPLPSPLPRPPVTIDGEDEINHVLIPHNQTRSCRFCFIQMIFHSK